MLQGVAGTLADETQVLYVSPLKALSNDINRNLTAPLAALIEQHRTTLIFVNTRPAGFNRRPSLRLRRGRGCESALEPTGDCVELQGIGFLEDMGHDGADATAPGRVFADSGYAGEKVTTATLIAVEIVRKNPDQIGFAEQAPRAARPHDIEDPVDDLAHRPLVWPALAQGLGKCGAITRHSASELRRRLGANGRRTVVENYSIQAVPQKYLAILDNVVGQVRTSDCMSVASCSDR
jgi:hypothetical protein